MRSITRLLTILATAFAVLALPAAAAFAYTPGVDDAFVTCTPGSADGIADCVVGKCTPGTNAAVQVEGGELFDDTVVADENGDVNFSFEFPTDFAGDSFEISAECVFNDEPRVLGEQVAKADVLAEDIAAAGANSMGIVGLAAVAIVLGGSALAVTRRRTTGIDA